MKPAIHYSVRLGHSPEIIAVTTVRGSHWWGRDAQSLLTTHGSGGLHGKFPTMEAAMAVQQQIARVVSHGRQQRNKWEHVYHDIRRAEEACIRQIVSGVPARGSDVVAVSVATTLIPLGVFLSDPA